MSTRPGKRPDFDGRVRVPSVDGFPAPSSLVEAFHGDQDSAADAIVLRGYAGPSTIVERILEFLNIAERNGLPPAEIQGIRKEIRALAKRAAEHNPLRIYLTPRLDRYVDFHPSSLVGYRYEPKAERQDAVTVWLKAYDARDLPIPYRVVQETRIGPSFAAYLGGELVDDYLEQSGPTNTAWGEQAGWAQGKRAGTTIVCGE